MHDSSSHAASTADTTSTIDHSNDPTASATKHSRKRRLTVAAAVVAAGTVLPIAAVAADSDDNVTADSPSAELAAETSAVSAPGDDLADAGVELVRPEAVAERVSRSGSDRTALEERPEAHSDSETDSPSGANRAGKKLNTQVPAPGSWHRHSSGYSWARWAGDINVPGSRDHGNPVRSVGAGTVTEVNHWNYSYGHHVVIGDKLYAHMSKIRVREGQHVRHGQMIGRVGSTGNSSGPHLHFESGRR